MRAWIVWSFFLWLAFGMHADAQAAAENQNLTPAEQAYLAFAKIEQSHFGQDDQASILARAYDTRFTPMQSPHSLAQASDRDLAALFRASSSVSFYAPSPSHLSDLRHDFAELEKRGAATDEQRQDVFEALFQSRDLAEMQRFAASHRNAGLPPPVTSDLAFSPGQMHGLLSVTGPHTVHPSVAVMPSGPFVVVISHPGCHFTQHAVQAIEHDEALRAMIKDHSVWVAPADRNVDLSGFVAWNTAHPIAPIALAGSRDAWPEVRNWRTPTFLFFRNGHLVQQVTGWPQEGNAIALKQAWANIAGVNAGGA